MESTAETSCLLDVLRRVGVRQWFEHDSSFQMVARLSLVNRAGSWENKSGRFCCFFQTCENDEPHLRLMEVSEPPEGVLVHHFCGSVSSS